MGKTWCEYHDHSCIWNNTYLNNFNWNLYNESNRLVVATWNKLKNQFIKSNATSNHQFLSWVTHQFTLRVMRLLDAMFRCFLILNFSILPKVKFHSLRYPDPQTIASPQNASERQKYNRAVVSEAGTPVRLEVSPHRKFASYHLCNSLPNVKRVHLHFYKFVPKSSKVSNLFYFRRRTREGDRGLWANLWWGETTINYKRLTLQLSLDPSFHTNTYMKHPVCLQTIALSINAEKIEILN